MKIKILPFNRTITIPKSINLDFGNPSGKQLLNDTSWLAEFLYKNRNENFQFFYGEMSMRKYSTWQLQKKIHGTYSSYMEPLAGIGIDAMFFMQDPDQIYLNELDRDCLKTLNANFKKENITKLDFFNANARAKLYSRPYDLIFLDYNNFSISKFIKNTSYVQETLDSFKTASKYVIINDSGVFYLRQYGKKSYEVYSKLLGTEIHCLEDYFHAIVPFWKQQCPDWNLTDIEHYYWAATGGNGVSSYLLFQRDPKPLHINFNPRTVLSNTKILDVEWTGPLGV